MWFYIWHSESWKQKFTFRSLFCFNFTFRASLGGLLTELTSQKIHFDPPLRSYKPHLVEPSKSLAPNFFEEKRWPPLKFKRANASLIKIFSLAWLPLFVTRPLACRCRHRRIPCLRRPPCRTADTPQPRRPPAAKFQRESGELFSFTFSSFPLSSLARRASLGRYWPWAKLHPTWTSTYTRKTYLQHEENVLINCLSATIVPFDESLHSGPSISWLGAGWGEEHIQTKKRPSHGPWRMNLVYFLDNFIACLRRTRWASIKLLLRSIYSRSYLAHRHHVVARSHRWPRGRKRMEARRRMNKEEEGERFPSGVYFVWGVKGLFASYLASRFTKSTVDLRQTVRLPKAGFLDLTRFYV